MAQTDSKTWTVLDLIQWTTSYFEDKGIDSPRLDAELLLAKVLGVDRMGLYINFDRPLAPAELDQYRELVKTRARRVPVKYMLGECEFMSLTFEVGPGVLIPRPETEHLVERAIDLLRAEPTGDQLALDIGTGSGCIAIALAKEVAALQVVASDISPAALAIAKRNAIRHGVADRVTLVISDLLDVHRTGPRADLIVSNPPYVAEPDWGALAPEITGNEPRTALLSGADGLTHIRRLFGAAPAHLRPGAHFLCEIGDGQAEAVRHIVEQTGAYENVEFVQDLGGTDRVADAALRRTQE